MLSHARKKWFYSKKILQELTKQLQSFFSILFELSYDQDVSLQIPRHSEHFQGGGSVQNPNPSGACGGLFKKVNFTFHITVRCIDFIQSYILLSTNCIDIRRTNPILCQEKWKKLRFWKMKLKVRLEYSDKTSCLSWKVFFKCLYKIFFELNDVQGIWEVPLTLLFTFIKKSWP